MGLKIKKIECVFWVWGIFFLVGGYQADADFSKKPRTVFLRIANLLPISYGPIDLIYGEREIRKGMKPGFFQPYTACEIQENKKVFLVRQPLTQAVRREFVIPFEKEKYYYTLVFLNLNKRLAVKSMVDDKRDDVLGGKRLRVFVGGYDFPIELRIEGVGEWKSDRKGVVEELFVEKIRRWKNPIASISFLNRYREKEVLYYPLNLKKCDSYSVFVSQRGKRRARIRCYPDAMVGEE